MDNKYLKEPGHYSVLIVGADATKSKKGDDMLVVTFKDIVSGAEIRGYYVPKYEFMAKKLAELKLACGVGPMAKKEELLGVKLIVGVRMQVVKPGQEKINEKTGKPYEPSAEVYEFMPFKQPASYGEEDNKLPF